MLLLISLALLCVRIIAQKGGQFSSFHIHDSKAMQERGIHCVADQDREEREKELVKVE